MTMNAKKTPTTKKPAPKARAVRQQKHKAKRVAGRPTATKRVKDGRWPSYEQWESFARASWEAAQTLAELGGEEEELFESLGHQARHLGLECTFVSEDESSPTTMNGAIGAMRRAIGATRTSKEA